MPRPKKNPVTDLPTVETFPVQHEPGAHDGIFDGIGKTTESNVVPIRADSSPIQSTRDWGEVDSVLSDIVNFV